MLYLLHDRDYTTLKPPFIVRMATTNSSVANFATLVGKYDATIFGGAVIDASSNIGSGDLLLSASNNQYLLNSNVYTSPAQTSGNGMTFTGWFYPMNTQATNATIFDISSSLTSSSIYLTCSSTTPTTLTAVYNGTSVTTSNLNAVVVGAWNFFTYVVLCNSSGHAVQMVYLNGVSTPVVSTATYVGGTVFNNNTIGYGPGLNYFNGKIDDFRYYNRVLTTSEINVLYNYNYQSTATPLSPSVLVSVNSASTFVGNPNPNILLDLSGIFSYVTIVRSVISGTTGTGASYTVSAASLVPSSSLIYGTWTDNASSLSTGNSYSYTVTPFILTNPGNSFVISVSTFST